MKYISNKPLIKTLLIISMMWVNIILACAKSTVITPDIESKYGKWMNLSTGELVAKGRDFLYQKQNPDSALVCFSIATSRYNKSLSKEEKQEIYKACTGKWYAQFFHYYDFPKAYESLLEALKISEETGVGRGMANLNLGMMYQMFGTDGHDKSALQTSRSYNRKAFEDALAERDSNVVHMAFSNMVGLASEDSDLTEMAAYREKYLDFTKGNRHPISSFNLLLYDINNAISHGEYDNALLLLDQQSQYVTPAQPRYLISILMMRANVMRLKHEYLQAEKLLNEAQEIALSENMKDVLQNIYNDKKELYHQSGDRSKEAEAYHSYLCMKDTLLNYRQISGFSEVNFLTEMERFDQTLSQIQYKRRVEAWIVAFCVLIICILGCSVVIIMRKNRKLMAANLSLYEKTKEEMEGVVIKQTSHSLDEDEPTGEEGETAMTPEEKANQEKLMNVIRGIAANSDELYSPKFTISKLAELTELPVKQLSKIINEETGENFNGFINRYRIKKACRMLDDVESYGSLTIENIGLNVGFRSRTAFISAFKKMTGLNPSDYLKAARQARLIQKASDKDAENG